MKSRKKARKQFQTTSWLLMYGAGGHAWHEKFNEDYVRYIYHALTNDDVS